MTVEEIVSAVSSHYNICAKDILSKTRLQPIARSRQVAMYLARELMSLSYTQTGDHFGCKRTSAYCAIEEVLDLMNKDAAFASEVAGIAALFPPPRQNDLTDRLCWWCGYRLPKGSTTWFCDSDEAREREGEDCRQAFAEDKARRKYQKCALLECEKPTGKANRHFCCDEHRETHQGRTRARQFEDVRRLHAQGMSVSTIAIKAHVSRTNVRKFLKQINKEAA